jgi:hypothetical protein
MSLDIEKLFARVTSVFLAPLINIIFLSVILLLSFMLSCLSYANFSKQLVDYDIDSFISDRSYNSSQPVKFPDFSTGETHPDGNFVKTRIGTFLRRACIRFAMLERLGA